MDKNNFKTCMMKLGALYGKELSNDMTLVYWDALNDLSDRQLGLAIDLHIKDPSQGVFFPKPAHLIKQIKGTPEERAESLERESIEAWAALMDGLERNYKLSDYGERTISAIDSIGGLHRLKTSTFKELDYIRKPFLECYQAQNHDNPLIRDTTKTISYQAE